MTSTTGLELPHWLDVAARSHPDKLALSFGDEDWSFAQLRHAAHIAATFLANARAERAGRIGILSANRPGFVITVHAASAIGVPFVPLNWRQTADEIAWQVRDANITILIADDQRCANAAACADQSVTILPIEELERVIFTGGEVAPATRVPTSNAPHPPQWEIPPSGGGGLGGEQGWGEGRGGDVKLPRLAKPAAQGRGRGVRADHEAAVLYTSGTSGRPKGARLTYGNLWFSAVASALHLGHHEDDVWLAALPLFHIGGLSILFRGVIGTTPVVLHGHFDPEASLLAIERGVTLVSLVPTMLQRLIEHRANAPWPAHLRRVLLGGSAAPPALINECLRLGIPVAPTYGLTEASSQVTTLLPAQAAAKPGSSGVPIPLTEVRIATASGNAALGEVGEIEVRGPTLFAGYLGERDAGSSASTDGWFCTGDAGYLDDDGYLYVVDRRDDLIVSGGENIYPAEIERVLREHPLVIDAGVVGMTDDAWGSRPIAAVVWNGDDADAMDVLHRHCLERLARYKVPDRIILVPDLPHSASGKLLRRVLRDQLQAGELA